MRLNLSTAVHIMVSFLLLRDGVLPGMEIRMFLLLVFLVPTLITY